jgi:hypothetical protein
MDRVEQYRQIVRRVIEEYAHWGSSRGEVVSEVVVDPQRDHYEVMHVGWESPRRRVHGTMLHIDIINGKVWIQYDGTDRPVAETLVASGIPREDIVLGFQPADLRQHTEFAAG